MEKRLKIAKYIIIINIILIFIQITIPLLLLAPHGHVTGNNTHLLNGYEMGRIALPASCCILFVLSIFTIMYKKDSLSICAICMHIFLLFFVITDYFKYVCIDTCAQYIATNSIPGKLTFILYLIEFSLIIISKVMVKRYNKSTTIVPPQVIINTNQDHSSEQSLG